MPSPSWLDDLRRLLSHIQDTDATELEYAQAGFRLRLRRRPGVMPRRPRAPDAVAALPADIAKVIAPLTGVFYRAPAPDAPPFVAEGDPVQPETVVGLIEAMKIFNEVTAECSGRVRQILAESGQLVNAGDCLMLVEPTGEGELGQVAP